MDWGDYRIEVVNDVGFGSFNFMLNIKCKIFDDKILLYISV